MRHKLDLPLQCFYCIISIFALYGSMRYALARKYNVEDVQYLALLRAFGHQKFPCPISSDRSRKKKERKGKEFG